MSRAPHPAGTVPGGRREAPDAVATMTAAAEPGRPAAQVPAAAQVAAHVHGWQLRTVDFVDGLVSHGYECEGCDAVRFT